MSSIQPQEAPSDKPVEPLRSALDALRGDRGGDDSLRYFAGDSAFVRFAVNLVNKLPKILTPIALAAIGYTWWR